MAASGQPPHRITPHLSDQANKLKLLLEMDDERRRQAFIRNLSENYQSNSEQPPREAVTTLASNQASVENQLKVQVSFYENALANLEERAIEIADENKKLYETMNRSVIVDADSSDEEDQYCKFSKSRPKERLLRTKSEFASSKQAKSAPCSDTLDSIEEPGQVNLFRNYKPVRRGSDGNTLDDTEDFSYASEPGQVIEIVTKKVTFDAHESSSLGRDEPNRNFPSNDETKKTVDISNTSMKDILHSEIEPFQPSGIITHENFNDEMKRMQDLYETKGKHLETLLKTARKQVEEQQIEITNMKGELRMYKTPVKEGSVDVCNWKPGYLKTSDTNLVQELLQERDGLFEAIKRQQTIVAEGNRHETEAYFHVKKSCEMVEQVQLEKQEAIVRTKQLEKDLDEYKEKYQILQKTHQEEMIRIGKKIRQESELTIEELNKKVEEQALNLTVLESHLEKSIREKMDLKNELDKFEIHTVTQQSTSTALIEESQKEVMEALKRQTLAEHETGQIRLGAKLREKRKQQEVEQLFMEVNELKRRLHVTEENLNVSQKNQLDITNHLNSCKQQLQHETSQRKMLIHTFEEDRKRMEMEAHQREQELSQVIHNSDKSYRLAKEELTKMLESQTHIVSKYQNECKELSEKVSTEQKQRQLIIAQLTDKCHQLEISLKDAFEKQQKKDVLLESYRQQAENADHELKQKKELVMMLMTKQSAILRDRYLLSKEVELLKSQLPSGTLTA